MTDYSFLADLLNKFSQLTPWVQAIATISFCLMIIALAQTFKETLLGLRSARRRTPKSSPQK